MQRNKVYAVMTLARVAQDLGESEDLLDELTDQMDTEDGLIWVYGTDDHHVYEVSMPSDLNITLTSAQFRARERWLAFWRQYSIVGVIRPSQNGPC